jgi:hypothetical protein
MERRKFTREFKLEAVRLVALARAEGLSGPSLSGIDLSKVGRILAAFRHTTENLPKYARVNVIGFPQVGVDPQVFN